MLIAGAGGHAREIQFEWDLLGGDELFFFDDTGLPGIVPDGFGKIIDSLDEAREIFAVDPRFIIGVGRPMARKVMTEKLESVGGKLHSLISRNAILGSRRVQMEAGLNVMSGAVVSTDVYADRGVLIHMHASVHHDCRIGQFCEISPGARILGGVQLEEGVSVGSCAVVLPGVRIGAWSVIGAGAVVTRDVPSGVTVAGVPAKILDRP